MAENVNKEGTIYVMKVAGVNGFRIGVYSTSRKARERQVRGGTGIKVGIIWEQKLSSKAHALAVEALAHLYLAKCEKRRQVGWRNIQIFECKKNLAEASCKRAIKVIGLSSFG